MSRKKNAESEIKIAANPLVRGNFLLIEANAYRRRTNSDQVQDDLSDPGGTQALTAIKRIDKSPKYSATKFAAMIP